MDKMLFINNSSHRARTNILIPSPPYRGTPWTTAGATSLCNIHHLLGSSYLLLCFSYHCYGDNTQLYLSFSPDDHTSRCGSLPVSDISTWISPSQYEHQNHLFISHYNKRPARTKVHPSASGIASLHCMY